MANRTQLLLQHDGNPERVTRHLKIALLHHPSRLKPAVRKSDFQRLIERQSQLFHNITLALITFLFFGMAASGCQNSLESKYAAANGTSINGVNSFVDLLRDSGHKVDILRGIGLLMKRDYQTLVLFQSTFHELSEDARREIRELTAFGTIRTLIIVVRDNDAAIDYWHQMSERPDLSSEDAQAARRSYDIEKQSFDALSDFEFPQRTEKWYGLKRVDRSTDSSSKKIEVETQDGPISVEARWPLNRRLLPSEAAEILWLSDADPLLTLEETKGAQILVLGSATPLLNGGLVDPGNRRLAAELINWIPKNDRIAVALSSDSYNESKLESPSLQQFIKVHPNGWVFGQGIFSLILFCWWKFPILGRPRMTVRHETARFGLHVEAFGKLLRRSRDVAYAKQRIREWNGEQKRRFESEIVAKSKPVPPAD